ncbi:MAG: hypothetical protein ACHP93_05430 [Solirubrobacterales bacterium]|nr:hypothetical protein [Thermoplasmata archaeon]
MIRGPAREFAKILERTGIEYLFVGGVAMAESVPSVTEDFDVMILPSAFDAAVAAVDRDPSVVSMGRGPAEMPGGHVLVRGALIRFDLLDPNAYSAQRSGIDFYRFVKRYHSRATNLGRVALPEVVWYMRLVIDDWELYVPKILRDVRAGAPWALAEKVRRIARRYGVEAVLRSRLARVEEDLRINHLLARPRPLVEAGRTARGTRRRGSAP